MLDILKVPTIDIQVDLTSSEPSAVRSKGLQDHWQVQADEFVDLHIGISSTSSKFLLLNKLFDAQSRSRCSNGSASRCVHRSCLFHRQRRRGAPTDQLVLDGHFRREPMPACLQYRASRFCADRSLSNLLLVQRDLSISCYRQRSSRTAQCRDRQTRSSCACKVVGDARRCNRRICV